MTHRDALKRALADHRAGRLEAAERGYQDVLSASPDDPDALHLLGLVHREHRDLDQAVSLLRRAVQLRPSSPPYCNSLGAVLTDLEQYAEAHEQFRRAVSLDPGYAAAYSNLGRLFHEQQKLDDAVASCRRAIELAPDLADAHYNLGNSLAARGDLQEALSSYRRAIALGPGSAKAHNNLAAVYLLLNRFPEAVRHFETAIELEPGFSQARKNLGGAYQDREMSAEAIANLRMAVLGESPPADAYNRLGVALHQTGELDDATDCFRSAVAINPTYHEAHNNLGTVLLEAGKPELAVESIQRALDLRPLWADAHFSMANACKALGRLPDAVRAYRRALDIRPDHLEAKNNLANVLKTIGRFSEATENYKAILERDPNRLIVLNNLGAAYKEMDLVDQASRMFQRVADLDPDNPLLQFRVHALCPVVFESGDAIDDYRGKLARVIDRYREMGIRMDALQVPGSGCEPPYNTAYHGRDELPLRRKYADIFRHCFPQERPALGKGRPRIGIVVTRDHEGVFLRSMAGLLQRLDPGRLDVTVVCAASGLPRVRDAIRAEHVRLLAISDHFDRAVGQIREARFELLYFWEVGSDPFNYFLPFLRLAAVQCVSWGTQYTTGVPAIDYHISCKQAEVEDASGHYCEQLVRLSTLPTYQARFEIPPPADRSHLGLPPSGHVYSCMQNVCKFHPDFDALLAEILRRDGDAVMVAIEGEQPHITDSLQRRFRRSMPDVADRIAFVPRMNRRQYLALLLATDVQLDPIHYGGGNTTYDALRLGVPVVTLPTIYQRGRYSAACYQRMDVADCVAESQEHYVDLAVQLATDRDHRQAVVEKIRARSDVLFEDAEAIREHGRFFEQAVFAAREGRGM